MSGAEIMSGAESRKWVHQEPTNQPTLYGVKRRMNLRLQLHANTGSTFGQPSIFTVQLWYDFIEI